MSDEIQNAEIVENVENAENAENDITFAEDEKPSVSDGKYPVHGSVLHLLLKPQDEKTGWYLEVDNNFRTEHNITDDSIFIIKGKELKLSEINLKDIDKEGVYHLKVE